MASPKKVMARMRPAPMVQATKNSPTPARRGAEEEEAQLGPDPAREGLVQHRPGEGPHVGGLLLGRASETSPHVSAPARCCPRPVRTSCVPPLEQERTQSERGGAIHEHAARFRL